MKNPWLTRQKNIRGRAVETAARNIKDVWTHRMGEETRAYLANLVGRQLEEQDVDKLAVRQLEEAKLMAAYFREERNAPWSSTEA